MNTMNHNTMSYDTMSHNTMNHENKQMMHFIYSTLYLVGKTLHLIS